MIQKLQIIYQDLQKSVNLNFKRSFYNDFDIIKFWATAIIWERWVWKTYFMLQQLKESKEKTMYFSADNMLVKSTSLFELVFELVHDYNISFIAIDEIHKFHNWQQHLKSIIDSLPDLHLIVSGSSSLDLYKKTADLQRRIYNFPISTLNFSEFSQLYKNISLPEFSFEEVINNYKSLSFDLSDKIDLNHFKEYINYWFYPYSQWKKEIYHSLLLKNLQKVILEDIPTFLNFNTSTLSKVEKLFYFIAHTAPSDLNYNSLWKKLGISKDLLETIILYLDKIWVLNMAIRSNKLTDIIRKEFKIFLWNPNIYYAYLDSPEIWTIRESFILKVLKNMQLKDHFKTDIILPRYWDLYFTYNWKQYLFEVWWKNKTAKQIQWIKNSYIISDDITIWTKNIIPLWLFGLIK